MIQYNDYIGLSFIKRLKAIDDDFLKKAEIHSFFMDYDKAEEIYNMMERRDLVISMRMKLGHWEKVIALVKESGFAQEDILKVAYNNLAKQCVENKDYKKAEELFTLTNNHEGLINLWFKTENYEKAAKLIDAIPEGNEFLLFMGENFETVFVLFT
jgi:WD repeat-containing protein 35